jgi:hypothetical protein
VSFPVQFQSAKGFKLPALSQLSRKVLTLPVQSGGTILVPEFGVNGIRGESLCKNVNECAKEDSGECDFCVVTVTGCMRLLI